MDSGPEIYQSLSDPDLLKVNTPLALIIGITLFLVSAVIISVHFTCSYKIGIEKTEIVRLYEQELLSQIPSAPEVF